MAELRIHAGLAMAAGAIFMPVCTACVGLRLYARRLHGLSPGADDWTSVAALVFVAAMGITIIIEVSRRQLAYPASGDLGKPNENIAVWPIQVLQVPALGLVKSSFILFYRRIFIRKAAPIFNVVSLVVLALIVGWMIAFFFAYVFICGTDLSAHWTSNTVEKAKCVDTKILHFAFAISDPITDIIVILLPLPMIWRLHLTTRRKFGVCGVFGLGALSIGSSVVRMFIFVQAMSVEFNPNVDFEFLHTAGVYWDMIESGLGLCAACLPVHYGLMKSRGVQRMEIKLRSIMSRPSRSLPEDCA